MAFYCRSCGSSSFLRLFEIKTWPISKCDRCGLIQVEKYPANGELKEIYGEHYFIKGKYREDAAGRNEQKRRLKFMESSGLAPGSRVLDYGMATGEFSYAARNKYTLWGMDISSSAVQKAAILYPEISERFVAGTIEKMVRKAEIFDAVVMWDVIEHIDDPLFLLTQVKLILRPGGFAFFSTPNIGSATFRMMGKRWHFMTPPEHLLFFDRETLISLAKKSGFFVQKWMTRGKWVNIDFLLYKINRTLPGLIPSAMQDWVENSRIGKLCVYAPTGDIQYLAVQLN